MFIKNTTMLLTITLAVLSSTALSPNKLTDYDRFVYQDQQNKRNFVDMFRDNKATILAVLGVLTAGSALVWAATRGDSKSKSTTPSPTPQPRDSTKEGDQAGNIVKKTDP